MASYEDFSKLEIRVGTVIDVNDHPDADKLYVLTVDIGTETRQIVAGMRKYYTPDEIKGKQIAVIVNLDPAVIRGVESQGMLLAAEKGKKVVLLGVDKKIDDGARVC
ncbi:MAG: methionine--tRNA ligase subunit beta [Candidatus Aenigmarchaeota archaeon]|nr:methionine--tRNA ligase subunit beta [Candidatus Aenigmarchaeota archaeon]